MGSAMRSIFVIAVIAGAAIGTAGAIWLHTHRHEPQPGLQIEDPPRWGRIMGSEPCPAPPVTPRQGEIITVADVTERRRGADGYAAPIHGAIVLRGRCYSFVSGGRGRGSIPFGRYHVSGPVKRPYLNPNAGNTAYHLSDVFDPITGDTRGALFIHPGRITKGCIGIDPAQWADFERDMETARPRVLNLMAGRA